MSGTVPVCTVDKELIADFLDVMGDMVETGEGYVEVGEARIPSLAFIPSEDSAEARQELQVGGEGARCSVGKAPIKATE